MAFSRAHLFDPHDQAISHYAHAISYPVRVDMLRHLIRFGPTPFSDFVRKYPLAPSTISQHFSILRDARLVTYSERYPTTIYLIDHPTLRQALKCLGDFLAELHEPTKTDLGLTSTRI